ncbi:MAG: type IV pilus assembly protein PilM [Candidatus Aminicenantia bacterium]
MFNSFKKIPLAIDISDFSIELLQPKKKLGKMHLQTYGRIKLEPGVVENGKILNKEKLKEKIKELLQNIKLEKLKTIGVIFSLPESRTFLHIFELPADISGKDLVSAVESQALKTIPLDLAEIYFDFQPVSRRKNIQEILYVAAPKEIVNEYLEVLKGAGLEPLVLDAESLSLARAFKYEAVLEGGMLIIDIGARTTILTIFDQDSVRLSSIISLAGNYFTKIIAQNLNISFKEAENLKRTCGLDEEKKEGRIMFILQNALDDILNKTKKLISFYEQKKGRKIKKIILGGGSSLMPKISSYFSSNLGIETKLGDPSLICPDLNKIKIESASPETADSPKLHPVLFSNVTGLALRALEKDPETAGINLIPVKERLPQPAFIGRKLNRSKSFTIFVVGLLILTFIFFGWVVYNYILKPPSVKIPEVEVPSVVEELMPGEEEEKLLPAIEIPLSFILVEETRILEVQEMVEVPDIFVQVLKEKLEEGINTRVLIRDLKENKFFALREFLESFGVKAPGEFYDKISGEFTLFVHSQEEGKRIGFVAKIKEKEKLIELLKDWELTMEKDFENLFVLIGKEKPALIPYFKSTDYKGTIIRYQTFSRQDLGICYSLFNDYFVFTSSFESIKKALDVLEIE